MSVKSDIRTFATEQNLIKPKQRLSTEVKVTYLRLNPARARALAVEAGIPVGKRGRISAEQFEAIANTV